MTRESFKKKISTCPYCKRKFIGVGNNPEDCGLHSFVKWNKVGGVCPICNMVVTLTNRSIKRMIEADFTENSIEMFKSLLDHDINFEEIQKMKEDSRYDIDLS